MVAWRAVCVVVLVFLAGCRSGRVEVAARATTVEGADGFPLTVLTFDDRAKEGAPPRAVIVYVQGSEDRSVTESAGALAGFCAMGGRVVAVERRGVSPEGALDAGVAARSCTREIRVADNAAVLEWAERRAPRGAPVMLVGASEGADVAAAVAAGHPELSRLILLGGGGGWSQAEEMRFFVRTRGSYLGIDSESALDQKLADVRAHPESGAMWLGHPYRRWATFMFARPVDDLMRVACPILVVQGERDAAVPVESARALKGAFDAAGKGNLTYVEIPGADHTFRNAESGEDEKPLVEVAVVRFLAGSGLLSEVEASGYEARVRRRHPGAFGEPH